MLAAGSAAAAASAAFPLGLPVIVPQLREEYALSIAQIGVLLAASWVGTTLTLLPWGLAADRFGERVVLTSGLVLCAGCLAAAAYAPDFETLVAVLALAGAAGASVNSSSGRAVMHWFPRSERGLALGIRQTAIPLGGLVAALSLPLLAGAGGSEAAFLFLAGTCGAGALVGALFLRLREPEIGDELEVTSIVQTLADTKLWRLSLGSGLYLYAQLAVLGFAVLFLHDEHGVSEGRAALVIAASQVLAMILRVGAGRWSDLAGSRVGPLLRIGVAVSAVMAAIAALVGGPLWLLVPTLALAGGLTMAWNGLSFTAAAELAGLRRSGAAIGFQQTVLGGLGVVAPIAFAATLAGASWRVAFGLAAIVPLGGVVLLRTLGDR